MQPPTRAHAFVLTDVDALPLDLVGVAKVDSVQPVTGQGEFGRPLS